MSDENFLSRWSRRKLASRATPAEPATPAEAAPVSPAQAARPSDAAVTPAQAGASSAVPTGTPSALPPVESLTPDSDFTPFMKPDVDGGVKRQALKALFQDPRYNVMDGLDVYIDDYSKPDPLPAGWLEKMTQTARLGEYRAPEPEADAEAAAQAEADADADAGGEKAVPGEAEAAPPGDPPAADPVPVDTPKGGTPPENISKSGDASAVPENISGVDFPQNKA
jgi:hypothetical protein